MNKPSDCIEPLSLLASVPPETLRAVGDELRELSPDELAGRTAALTRRNPQLGMLAVAYAQTEGERNPIDPGIAFLHGVLFVASALQAAKANQELEALLTGETTPQS